ncbi:hypothetical protein OROGR_013866 [Orobanche gracilis]
MATFSLTSNNYFLRTYRDSPDIFVFDFKDDITSFDIIRSPPHWTLRAIIGNSQKHNALEIFGTTIHGDKLVKLASDLTLKSGAQTFYMIVNREGLCFLSVNDPVVKRLRINDYFGWSKYGVELKLDTTVWNKFDLHDGRIVVDMQGMKKSLSESKERETELSETLLSKSDALDACTFQLTENRAELSGLKKILDEMEKSLSESKDREAKLSDSLVSKSEALQICKSQLMENQTELSRSKKIQDEMKKSLSESKDRETELRETLLSKSDALDICKSHLTENRTELSRLKKILEQMKNEKEELEKKWIEEAKSGEEWRKVAEEREEELRKVKNQLVAKTKHADTLKGVTDSLMNSMWDLNKIGRREMAVLWQLAVLKVGAIPSSLRTWWINNQVK